MNAAREFHSFREFWPFYVSEHRHPVSRALHVSGTTLGLLIVGMIAHSGEWKWIWLALVVGYGFAWLGHFAFERNRPATFRHPLYSLMGDLYMLFKTLTFGMRRELEKAQTNKDQTSRSDE